jgi:hypothetical protein
VAAFAPFAAAFDSGAAALLVVGFLTVSFSARDLAGISTAVEMEFRFIPDGVRRVTLWTTISRGAPRMHLSVGELPKQGSAEMKLVEAESILSKRPRKESQAMTIARGGRRASHSEEAKTDSSSIHTHRHIDTSTDQQIHRDRSCHRLHRACRVHFGHLGRGTRAGSRSGARTRGE